MSSNFRRHQHTRSIHNPGVRLLSITQRPEQDGTKTYAKIRREEGKQRFEAIENLPEVLAIQKKKLLKALNKTAHGTPAVSQEEEQLVTAVRSKLDPITVYPSLVWEDSKLILKIKTILQNNSLFDLPEYLACAEIICKAFLMKKHCFVTDYDDVLVYVLTHARKFGDPSKTIFQIEEHATKSIKNIDYKQFDRKFTSKAANSAIMSHVEQLIEELKGAYDEAKLQALNIHITSFTLLILRRLVKNNEHEMARGLCKSSQLIVIYAYLTTEDVKTKNKIREACVKYMEWFDMQLPDFFFRVADLYNIEAGKLWDILSKIQSAKTAASLFVLAAEYYNNWLSLTTDASQNQRFFPYCRLLDSSYHRKLSNRDNAFLCKVLSQLIEKKNSPVYFELGNTGVSVTVIMKEVLNQMTDELYNKINNTNY